jgi:hypothetical protein
MDCSLIDLATLTVYVNTRSLGYSSNCFVQPYHQLQWQHPPANSAYPDQIYVSGEEKSEKRPFLLSVRR